jgi:tight adherence protein B
MRRLLPLLLALTAVAGSIPAAQAAQGPDHTARGVGFTLDPGARFPARRFLVTLPPGIAPYDVHVTENGIPVIPHLRSVGNGSIPLSVAILLDTSDSMRGARLAAAADAARTLIDARPARAQVAVFGFARHPHLVRGWSSDASLGVLHTSSGTALWDSVTAASQLLGQRTGSSHAIVLLTDGRDTSSAATEKDAAAAAHAAGARVFAVVLPGKADTGALEDLAQATGGQLVHVRSIGALHQVYASLAQRLRQQYVLTYSSQLRHVGSTADVRLTVAGRSADARYTVPALPSVASVRARGWWTSDQAIAALAGAVAMMVALASYLLIRPKHVGADRRLRGYVGGAPSAPAEVVANMPVRPQRMDARPRSSRVWTRFSSDVQRAGLAIDATRLITLALTAGLAIGAVSALLTGQPYGLLAAPVLAVGAVWAYVTNRASGWYTTFDAALPEALNVLASSLRAGHSLMQAITYVCEEADDETRPEWEEVVRQTRLGVPVEDAVEDMTSRIGNSDLAWVAMIARVQHQVGGNMAEMFDIVADTIRQRHRLRTQLRTLTAQGRMTRWVLTFAPFFLGLVMMTFSPTYITSFLGDPTGRALLAFVVAMVIVGSLWLKRVVEFEV